jgi:hypothetical protein
MDSKSQSSSMQKEVGLIVLIEVDGVPLGVWTPKLA